MKEKGSFEISQTEHVPKLKSWETRLKNQMLHLLPPYKDALQHLHII